MLRSSVNWVIESLLGMVRMKHLVLAFGLFISLGAMGKPPILDGKYVGVHPFHPDRQVVLEAHFLGVRQFQYYNLMSGEDGITNVSLELNLPADMRFGTTYKIMEKQGVSKKEIAQIVVDYQSDRAILQTPRGVSVVLIKQ